MAPTATAPTSDPNATQKPAREATGNATPTPRSSIWATARLELHDPTKLVLEKNSRDIDDLSTEDPEFCQSIAHHGVLVPLIANPLDDGRLHVRDGDRRALAAALSLKAGSEINAVVPVVICDSSDPDEWARIQEQFVVNHNRAGYTEANKARLYEQGSLIGYTAEDLADQFGGGTTADAVRAGLAVRGNAAAKASLQQHPQLSLEQAAALVEFDDDEQASATLQTTLEKDPEQFDHAVARLRRDRNLTQAREALRAQLLEQGVPIVERSYDDAQQKTLRELVRSREDNTNLGEDPQAHANCPGHAAYIPTYGEPEAVYVCTQWKRQRHVDRYGASGTTGAKSEAEKAEMRRVRQNNSDWRAAEGVRREFLRKLVSRKTPPTRAQHFLTSALLADDGALQKAQQFGHVNVRKLFGEAAAVKDRASMVSKLGRASANEAIMMQLTVVLAAYESSTNHDTWRRTSADHQRYLAALAAWGYTLSPVEQLAVDNNINTPVLDAVTGRTIAPGTHTARTTSPRMTAHSKKSATPVRKENTDATGPAESVQASADTGPAGEKTAAPRSTRTDTRAKPNGRKAGTRRATSARATAPADRAGVGELAGAAAPAATADPAAA